MGDLLAILSAAQSSLGAQRALTQTASQREGDVFFGEFVAERDAARDSQIRLEWIWAPDSTSL